MYNILCFGDSNTFGTNPSGGRWDRNQRWTGLLQQRLGSGFYVIEEGLGGRTATSEDFLEPDKNGYRHLPVALRSHRPLDLVILMLGTNDMKHRFALLPEDIAQGAAQLGRLAETYDYGPGYSIPKILLVSPIHIEPGIEHSVFTGFSADAVEISHKLAPLYRAHAEANSWLYLNAADLAQASQKDKLHMEAEGHLALAQAIGDIILKTFPRSFSR